MITKAVIAAAGRGTRFLPVVKSYPKELVPILSKPNIQYLIEEAVGAGIKEVAIVIRHGENRLQSYFQPDLELETYLKSVDKSVYLNNLKQLLSQVKIIFLEQPITFPYGTGSPLLAAQDFVGQDPFIYMYGDDLTIEPVPGQFIKKMIALFNQYQPDEVIAVKDVGLAEISRYGSAQYIDDPKYPHRISAMLEKLPADQAPSTFAQGGRFLVTSKIFPILAAQKLSYNGELLFSDASSTLAKTNIVLTQTFNDDTDWLTTGDPLRWLQANIVIALRHPEYQNQLSKFLQLQL